METAGRRLASSSRAMNLSSSAMAGAYLGGVAGWAAAGAARKRRNAGMKRMRQSFMIEARIGWFHRQHMGREGGRRTECFVSFSEPRPRRLGRGFIAVAEAAPRLPSSPEGDHNKAPGDALGARG